MLAANKITKVQHCNCLPTALNEGLLKISPCCLKLVVSCPSISPSCSPPQIAGLPFGCNGGGFHQSTFQLPAYFTQKTEVLLQNTANSCVINYPVIVPKKLCIRWQGSHIVHRPNDTVFENVVWRVIRN